VVGVTFPMKAYIPTSPLALAVRGKHVAAAKLLLECGAVTRHGRTVKQEKSSDGHRVYGGYGERVGEFVTTVYDALLDAVKTGCLGMVALLLPVAASKAAADKSWAAAARRQPAVAANAEAVAAAAVVARRLADALHRSASREGEALRSAAALGFVDIVAFLLDSMEVETPVLGHALRDAVGHGHIDMARLLLERGAPVQYEDVSLQQHDGVDNNRNVEGEGEDPYRNAPVVPRSSLVIAAGLGRPDIVQLLLSQGPAAVDVNGWHFERTDGRCVHDKSYRFPYYERAEENSVSTTFFPFTALHAASRRGDLELIQLLLQHGAYTNIFRSLPASLPTEIHYRAPIDAQSCATCMREALIAGNTDALRVLLAHSEHAPIDCILLLPLASRLPAQKTKGDDGAEDSGQGRPEVVQLLLDMGDLSPAQVDDADVNRGGKTALRYAFDCRHAEVMALLLDRGATLSAMYPLDAHSPLFHATDSAAVKVAELLLDRGEDVHARDGRGGTLLIAACRRGGSSYDDSEPLLSLLMARGAAVNSVDTMGITALHAACATGHRSTGSVPLFLLTHGADVNALCNRQRTPLHYACMQAGLGPGYGESGMRRSEKVVECLLARGAQVDSVDATGRTALHHACEGKDAQSVARLIARGANANAVDAQRSTPLHLVCRHNDDRGMHSAAQDSVDIVKLLLQCPDIHADAVNDAGDTALLSAMTMSILNKQFAEMVSLLVRHGVFLNIANPAGDTPLVRLVRVLDTVRVDYGLMECTHVLDLLRLMLDSGANPTHLTGHVNWPHWQSRLK
jgi:ankyrin repeat protein